MAKIIVTVVEEIQNTRRRLEILLDKKEEKLGDAEGYSSEERIEFLEGQVGTLKKAMSLLDDAAEVLEEYLYS